MADRRIPSERTRLRLEELQRLLKAEKGSVSILKLQELFKRVFGSTGDIAKEVSRYRNVFPSYFKGITIVDTFTEGNKFRDYLLNRAKNLKSPLTTDIPSLQKAAGTELEAATAWNVYKRHADKSKIKLGKNIGFSIHDAPYKTSKKFRDFVEALKKDWSKMDGYEKNNAWHAYLKRKPQKLPAGFTLNNVDFLKKIGGLSEGSLAAIVTKPEMNTTALFFKDNFKYENAPTAPGEYGEGKGTRRRYWKDPSEATVRKWKQFKASRIMTNDMRENVKTLNKKFRNLIIDKKKLPTLKQVQTALNTKSPTTAANSMMNLARLYKGDPFRADLNIETNVPAGKRLIRQIGELGIRDAYRVAFYQAALDNVGKLYKGGGNITLATFQKLFRDELRNVLDLGAKEKIPFSVNEVIGISTGEMRGLQPYTAFIDITQSKINEGALAQYQGSLSAKIGQVQEVMAGKGKYSNLSEVERVAKAESLAKELRAAKETFKTSLMDPKKKWKLTPQQVEQLGFADIKIGGKVTDTFTRADLEKWKTQSKGVLDIEKMHQRQGFYIDPKGRRPYFDISKTELFSRVRDIFTKGKAADQYKVAYQLKCVGKAEGGRIGFALGTGAINCVENKLKNQTLESTKALSALEEGATGVLGKVKNAAQGFLGALGRFGPAAGKYGAIAAVGALAQPLVKQFMNDDPSTYLTDPDQQAGMLEALIEGERPKPRSEILDTATTVGALGATAAAVPGTGRMYDYRRGLLEAKIPKAGPVSEAGLTAGDYLKKHGKGYGKLRAGAGVGLKLLSGMYTPAGILATEPLRIAQMRREGESWGEVAKSPTLWMGPAFADTMTRIATAGMKPSSKLARALSLGMSRPMLKTVSRRFGMPGLALSAGLSGYDLYKDYKKKRGFFARDED